MSDAPEGTDIAARVARLRGDFDAAFALPPAEGRGATERLIVVGAGGARFALPLAELAGFRRLRKLCKLPGAASELLGLASVRAGLLPVFGLARLLGCGADEPRWLAIARGEPLGLAFGGLHEYLEVPLDAARGDRPAALEVIGAGAGAARIVRMSSILAAIRERGRTGRPDGGE